MFTIIAKSYFPETPEIRRGISNQKLFLVKLKHFLIDVALIAVLALVWDILNGLSMCSWKFQMLSILIFDPCFRHTVEITKVGDTSAQLKQTNKQPCKQTS